MRSGFLVVVATIAVAGPVAFATDIEGWRVAVSVKVILDGGGERPVPNYFGNDEQIEHAVRATNAIFAQNGASWSFVLDEIVEIGGHSEFFRLDDIDVHGGLEAAARAAPGEFSWRDDAINVYIVEDAPLAGICSFPPDGEIIVIQTRERPGGHEDNLWAHEIGHYLSLLHPFSCVGLDESECDSGSFECSDQGALHAGPRGHVFCADVCAVALENVMHFRFVEPERAVFTRCQLREMWFELFDSAGSRAHVLHWIGDVEPDLVPFVRGDSNGDAELDISDAVNTLSWLFLGSGALDCPDAGDVDDSGVLDISDAVSLLQNLFLGIGSSVPLGACVPDELPDDLPYCLESTCWG